jgi:hypothetical protein
LLRAYLSLRSERKKTEVKFLLLLYESKRFNRLAEVNYLFAMTVLLRTDSIAMEQYVWAELQGISVFWFILFRIWVIKLQLYSII